MKIKITDANLDAVQAALNAVNGRARAHTYTASNILALAQGAEAKLKSLRIPSRLRSGATVHATSGDKLAKAYKGKVIRTYATLVRGSRDWFITDAHALEQWPDASRPRLLIVTEPVDPMPPDNARTQQTYKI